MDCLHAQQLIAEALDHSGADETLLEEAKQHCRACEDCGRFIKAQLALKRSSAPAAPADLADRVIAAVRADVATEAARATGEVSDSEGELTAEAAQVVAALPLTTAARPTRRPDTRVWVAAAAGVLLFAGVGAMMAATLVSRSAQTRLATTETSDQQMAAAPEAAAPPAGDASKSGGALSGPAAAVPMTGPSFIAVNGVAYSLRGTSSVARSSLSTVGSTTSSLDVGSTTALSHNVLAAHGDLTVVYVEDDSALLEFERVVRDYDSKQYALQTGPIPSFGVWPSLPAGIATPTSSDGSPTFESVEASASATVYVKVDSDASAGIAFPPGAAGPPSVSGAPTWTWWTPLP